MICLMTVCERHCQFPALMRVDPSASDAGGRTAGSYTGHCQAVDGAHCTGVQVEELYSLESEALQALQ